MSITIKDIAMDTGLSVATISKYLNNKPILSKNREVIAASIEKLHYIPNDSARGLRSKRSHTIGIIIPTLNNSFWGTVLGYSEEELRLRGYSVICCSHEPNEESSKKTIRALLDKKIDGAILIPYSQEDCQIISVLKDKIPCISLDHVLESANIDAVTSANYEGGYEAIKYLLSQGHRRIGILAGPKNSYTAIERTRGALAALRDAGIAPESELIAYTEEFLTAEGQHSLEQIMNINRPPTAVFAVNYDICIGALINSSMHNYRIPKDLSIVGFDDDIIFSSVRPGITVVNQNIKELGRQAANLLLRRIEGDWNDYPSLIKIPASLITRDSVCNLKERL
ncbi:MAG: LacI family DNA-binding transcriptional regulator [Lachnospiraceae bacterium]|nr:LacI family DNA-binding transcriptional regulator [Lachnospiraceae bacterium]MDD3614750.1 LacI family DNA-binding transcriptional regulator [Lachnospiraceae bacterium]